MTAQIITNKITTDSTFDLFKKFAKPAKKIIIAVAFFSDSGIINNLLKLGK